MPPPEKAGIWRRLRPYGVAAFATFHLLCVLAYMIPYSRRIGPRMMKHPDARQEINRTIKGAYEFLGRPGPYAEFHDGAIDAAKGYGKVVKKIRSIAGIYTERVGSDQSWNMFGGTPPKHPLVAMMEVKPKGKKRFQPWIDGHFGASGEAIWDFRHRKAQETMFLSKGQTARKQYAAFWAHRWEQEHPGQKLKALRFYYLKTTTPSRDEVSRGKKPAREQKLSTVTYKPTKKAKGAGKGKHAKKRGKKKRKGRE